MALLVEDPSGSQGSLAVEGAQAPVGAEPLTNENAGSFDRPLTMLSHMPGYSPGHPSLGPSHPVSQKLRTILTRKFSKYEEGVMRDGLRALEDIYAGSSASSSSTSSQTRLSPTGSRRRRKRMPASNRIDLEYVRRHYQEDAQRQLLASSGEYIALLEQVDAVLMDVQSLINSMRAACDDVDQRLSLTNDATHYLLEQAEGLQRQSQTTEQQRALLNLFLARFTLTQEEADAIQKRDVPVGSSLFAAMDRVIQIRQDCRALLEGGGKLGGGSRAGTDIMALMSNHLDVAHQKLAKYLGFHFRQAPKESLDVSRTLRESVHRLARGNREDLLRPALQVLASIRSSFLASSFQQALIQGTPGSRPIEMHAHDPLRYVGDMLAWVHQAVAGEREFLGQLFGERDGEDGRRVGERRRGIEGSIDWSSSGLQSPNSQEILSKQMFYMMETLDKCLEGCCRPLQLRVEQTIHAQEGAIPTFRLLHLARFYEEIMINTLGSRAALTQVLTALKEVAQQAFHALLDRWGSRLAARDELPDADLRPPASLLGAIGTLKELLSSHASSNMEASTSPSSTADNGAAADDGLNVATDRLLKCMTDLVDKTADRLQACGGRDIGGSKAKAKGTQSVNRTDRNAAVFRLNCLERILDATAAYDIAAESLARVRQDVRDTKDQLVEVEHDELLSQSGLKGLMAAASAGPAPTTEVVEQARSQFDATFLQTSSAIVVSSPLLSRLVSSKARAEIHQQALEAFARDYDKVYSQVAHGHKGGSGWRTPAEMRLLLGV